MEFQNYFQSAPSFTAELPSIPSSPPRSTHSLSFTFITHATDHVKNWTCPIPIHTSIQHSVNNFKVGVYHCNQRRCFRFQVSMNLLNHFEVLCIPSIQHQQRSYHARCSCVVSAHFMGGIILRFPVLLSPSHSINAAKITHQRLFKRLAGIWTAAVLTLVDNIRTSGCRTCFH